LIPPFVMVSEAVHVNGVGLITGFFRVSIFNFM